MVPVKLLSSSARFFRLVIAPYSQGIDPVKSLRSNPQVTRLASLAYSGGSTPVMSLRPRPITTIFVHAANCGGSVPVKSLRVIWKYRKRLRRANCDGMDPLMLLSLILMRSNECSHDISTGKIPSIWLARRSSSRRTPSSSHGLFALENQVHSSLKLNQPSFRSQD